MYAYIVSFKVLIEKHSEISLWNQGSLMCFQQRDYDASHVFPPCYIPEKNQRSISEILLGQHFTSALSKLLLGRKKSPVSVHVGVINSEIRRKSFAYTELTWVMQWNNFIEVFQSYSSKYKVQNKQDAMVFLTSQRTLDKSDFTRSGEQMSILELLPTSTKNKSNVI